MRKDFREIVDALAEKEISISQIYTNGLLVNSNQLNGMDQRGIKPEFPSLYDMSIVEAMTDSVYLTRISTPVHELLEHQPQCAVCEYRLSCAGGCPYGE